MSTRFTDSVGPTLDRRKIKIVSQTAEEIVADITRYPSSENTLGTPLTSSVLNGWEDTVTQSAQDSQTAKATAQTASTVATAASQTATLAKTTADEAHGMGSSAVVAANEAKATAQQAEAVANAIDAKATSALEKSAQAIVAVDGQNAGIAAYKTELNTRVNGLEANIVDQQGTRVSVNGVVVSDFDANIKADKTSLAIVSTSGSYNDLSNKPQIPAFTSELTNNSGLMTKADLLNFIYPVGSIYESNVNTSPQVFLGGVWSSFGGGQFLLGQNTTYKSGSGGQAVVTLTEEQMPRHNHKHLTYWSVGRYGTDRKCVSYDEPDVDAGGRTEFAGGGQAHNNMPPYVIVYRWVRTA